MWQQQWELFAPNFKDGKAHIDLSSWGCQETLELYPGPGFGDFSHPTTQLMVSLLGELLEEQSYKFEEIKTAARWPLNSVGKKLHVIDIGCGSGILSLVAALFNITQIYGFDCDVQAVNHAKKNLTLYKGSHRPIFSIHPPQEIPSPSLLLMNMIHTEQAQAWKTLIPVVHPPTVLITSGILREGKDPYLRWAEHNNWVLARDIQKDGWYGFIFTYVNK